MITVLAFLEISPPSFSFLGIAQEAFFLSEHSLLESFSSLLLPTFLWISLFGILGMTILFPLLALPFYFLRRRREQGLPESKEQQSSLLIFIPVHNNADGLRETLRSVQDSISHYQDTRQASEQASGACNSGKGVFSTIEIFVGLDACTDNSPEIAKDFTKSIFRSERNLGKWAMIKKCLSMRGGQDPLENSASWIAFVDAGAIWPRDLLVHFSDAVDEEEVVAFAPSYGNSSRGILERCTWGLEAALKSLENLSGGPISIHGATVFYREDHLRHALRELPDGQPWLNDDVTIPIALRIAHPLGRIKYSQAALVGDSHHGQTRREFRRRRRMVLGNLQWIIELLPRLWVHNSSAAILSLRRVFRMLWAYWFLAAWFGIFGGDRSSFFMLSGLALMVFMIGASQKQSLYRAGEAFLASLLVPLFCGEIALATLQKRREHFYKFAWK